MMKISLLLTAGALAIGACTASNPDATRSNCKLATDALDVAQAAVKEYQDLNANKPMPTALTDQLKTAAATATLVCG